MSEAPQPVARTDFYQEIRRNKWRTFWILVAFVVLILLVGAAFDVLIGAGFVAVAIALVVAIVMAFFSYFYSDRVALAASRAKPAEGEEYRRYHNLVEGLCIAAGLPKPKLYVVEDPAPNAFATGRNPKHSSLAVTTGLLNMMNRVELEGVIAHELSHVKNYDILAGTVAVIAVGTIALLADLGLRFMWFGGGKGRRDSRDSGGIGIVLVIIAFALLVLAPVAAQLMQFSMSRKRELLADATGVQLTRYPPGLCSALKKLRDDTAVVHYATRATAQLWIESPLERDKEKKQGSWLNRAFDTHPPLDDRIRTLESM